MHPYASGCPYKNITTLSFGADNHDTVQMIRHNNELIEFNVGSYARSFEPFFLYDCSDLRKYHLLVPDRTEHTSALVRADGDEILSGLSIIISRKANRSSTELGIAHNSSQ
jgi:hypothetical protein